MPENRFFIPEELFVGGEIHLEGSEYLHMSRVMRKQEGDPIELINGKGILAQGKILACQKRGAQVAILSVEKRLPPAEICLGMAWIQKGRLDLVLEKGVELGVTEFWLYPGEKGKYGQPSPEQMRHCQHLLQSALKQCGRLDLPKLRICPPLMQWKEIPEPLFFGDLSEKAPGFWDQLQKVNNPRHPSFFLIGPEGGFSEKEILFLREKKASGVRLHPNILRSETAAIAAIALLAHWQYHSPGER